MKVWVFIWSLFVIICHYLSLLVIIGYYWSLFVIIFSHYWSLFGHYLSLFGHYWSLLVIISHYWSLFLIIYSYWLVPVYEVRKSKKLLFSLSKREVANICLHISAWIRTCYNHKFY